MSHQSRTHLEERPYRSHFTSLHTRHPHNRERVSYRALKNVEHRRTALEKGKGLAFEDEICLAIDSLFSYRI